MFLFIFPSHAAAQSKLAEIKQLYQAQVSEKKFKQELEESQTSFVMVCSLLHGHYIFNTWVFTDTGPWLLSHCFDDNEQGLYGHKVFRKNTI